jgi:integrase
MGMTAVGTKPKRGRAKKSAAPERPRRGWREKIEPGLYRSHRVGCRASETQEPGVRCGCPFQAHLRGTNGSRYPQNLRATTIAGARREKQRRQRAQRGGHADPRTTVSEFFWDAFLPKQQLRPATKRNYARVFRNYCEPVVGDLPLVEVHEEHVLELLAHLDECARERREITGRRNERWVAQHLIPLRSALSAARRWRRIEENPLREAQLPECPPKKPGESDCKDDPKAILSVEQVDELCEAALVAEEQSQAGMRDAALFRVTYELALRNSEARGLRWGDVDFEEWRVEVARQIDPVTGEESQTKGKRSRALPADRPLVEVLKRWHRVSVKKGGADPDGYIWHGRDPAAPMPISLPTARIAAVQELAGLVDSDDHPLIVFHGLRHSRASHLLLGGAPMLEVSRYLGHASQLITAGTYSHLVPSEEFAGIQALFGGRQG